MIRHIVLFTVSDKSEIDAIVDDLRQLREIPDSLRFEVLRNENVDPIAEPADIVVYGEFPDLDALHRFKAHPTYSRTTAVVRPRREMRFSADVSVEVA